MPTSFLVYLRVVDISLVVWSFQPSSVEKGGDSSGKLAKFNLYGERLCVVTLGKRVVD